IDVGDVVDDLETDAAVTRDHCGIIEWVDERELLGIADPLHLREPVPDVLAMEDDARAIAEAGFDLRADRSFWHHDRDRHPGSCPGPRVRLSGVSRRQGDRATRAGSPGQR